MVSLSDLEKYLENNKPPENYIYIPDKSIEFIKRKCFLSDNSTDYAFNLTHEDCMFLNKIDNSEAKSLARIMPRRSGATTLLVLAAIYQTMCNRKKCLLLYPNNAMLRYALNMALEDIIIMDHNIEKHNTQNTLMISSKYGEGFSNFILEFDCYNVNRFVNKYDFIFVDNCIPIKVYERFGPFVNDNGKIVIVNTE